MSPVKANAGQPHSTKDQPRQHATTEPVNTQNACWHDILSHKADLYSVSLCCLDAAAALVQWRGEYLPAQTVDPLTNQGYNHVPAAGSEGMHGTLRLFPALQMQL